MQGFGHDPHDAEWESPNTGRTAYRPSEDDDYCEGCDGSIVTFVDGTQRCRCDAVTHHAQLGFELSGDKWFAVMTLVDDGRVETVVVPGDTEWQARTNARVVSELGLHGNSIEYQVISL